MSKQKIILTISAIAAIYVASCSTTKPEALSVPQQITNSPKMLSREANPLIDFMFTADPTAVVHDGRIYVYGTNDHQQYLNAEKNTYEKIKSLVVISSDDMANWTYHGIINVEEIAPWIITSWAPSIVKKRMPDGKEHFFLYFSNTGEGVGIIESTTPLGPWSDPLGHPLIERSLPTMGDCPNPFDPGVALDENGCGWLTFGAGIVKAGSEQWPKTCRIVQLGEDMVSLASDIKPIPAPMNFEASELNYWNGTWVYTFNTNWVSRDKWPLPEHPAPSICSMAYMTSSSPLEPDSWQYRGDYFPNPGETVGDMTNNHTHIENFKGHNYLFHHSMYLQDYYDSKGGFRNMGVEEVQIDSLTHTIHPSAASRKGVEPLSKQDAFAAHDASMVAATYNVNFIPGDEVGNMMIAGTDQPQVILVRNVDFDHAAKKINLGTQGHGRIDIYADSLQECPICLAEISPSKNTHTLENHITGTHDLYFVVQGPDLVWQNWAFQ